MRGKRLQIRTSEVVPAKTSKRGSSGAEGGI